VGLFSGRGAPYQVGSIDLIDRPRDQGNPVNGYRHWPPKGEAQSFTAREVPNPVSTRGPTDVAGINEGGMGRSAYFDVKAGGRRSPRAKLGKKG